MDSVRIKGHSQQQLSISGVAAQTDIQLLGVYDVWSDKDCFLKVAATANDVTTSTGYALYANNVVPVSLDAGDRIGAITAGDAGTLRFHRVA